MSLRGCPGSVCKTGVLQTHRLQILKTMLCFIIWISLSLKEGEQINLDNNNNGTSLFSAYLKPISICDTWTTTCHFTLRCTSHGKVYYAKTFRYTNVLGITKEKGQLMIVNILRYEVNRISLGLVFPGESIHVPRWLKGFTSPKTNEVTIITAKCSKVTKRGGAGFHFQASCH